MFRLRTLAAGLAFALAASSAARAALIADYGAEFNGSTPNTGWSYLWNAPSDWDGSESYNAVDGAIGNSANYVALKSTGSTWTADGDTSWQTGKPASFLYLGSAGGHPGRGSTQTDGIGNILDRHPIAAYTIQPGEGGLIQITNSSLAVPSSSSTGVELQVYVNDTLATRFVRSGGGISGSFNGVLGILNPGDTVYVAMGPNTADGSDSFNVAYQLETVTDSSVVVWDADGTLPINGGTGPWNTGTPARWYTGSGGGTYTTWNNGGNLNANFLAGGGTVTLGESITTRSLTFSADGYTIDGTSTLTLSTGGSGGPGPATISVVSDTATATISAPVSGSALNKIDMGTLVLEGNNTFSQINAAGGNLVLAGSSVTTASDLVRVGTTPHWVAGGSSGTLTIQDSASLTTGRIFMGDNYDPTIGGLTGVINQTGGTVTVTGSTGENAAIRVGHWPSETSTYNLSGGVLNITGTDQDLALGTDGAGIFYQTGGEAFAPGVMVNHRNANGSGSFTVRGGTFNVGDRGIQTAGGPATVGIGGAGGTLKASASFSSALDMTITGGAKNGAYFDTDGNTIDLSGNLTGGGDFNKVGDGTLTLSGTANALGRIYAAGGNLVFDSGSVTTSSGMQVGANDYFVTGGGSGTATVQGTAVLTTGSIVMGDNYGGPTQTNFFNQTGGTVNVTGYSTDGAAPAPNQGGLRIGHWPNETSTYNLSGGALNLQNPVAGILLATDGNGTFYQTGGTANAAFVKLNTRTSGYGTGIFTLEGGSFELGSGGIVTDAGPYTINLGGAGATLRAAASWSSSLAMTLSGTGANAIHFDTGGHTITLSGQLTGTGGLNKVGDGTLAVTSTNSSFTGPTTVSGGTLSASTGRLYDIGWGTTTVTVTGGALVEVGGWGDGDGRGIGKVSFSSGNIVIDDGTIRYTATGYSGRRDRGFTIGAGGATLESAGSIPWVLSAERVFSIVSTAGGSLTLNGSSDGQVDKPIPGTGDLVKNGSGTWTLTAENTYSGSTDVDEGTLALVHATSNNTVANSPTITVGTGATFDVTGLPGATFDLGGFQVLRGTGSVAGTVGGPGLVSPGASPGILTATAVDPTGGSDYEFEFTEAVPNYGDPDDSLNDVLRLRDLSAPFAADLGPDNVVDIYLNVTDLAVGDSFQGGFYTDRPAEFLDQIDDATINFYVAATGGSVHFEGVDYVPLDEYLPVAGLTLSTVYAPVDFGDGQVYGYVMQIGAVPEPASGMLAAVGLVLLLPFGRRLRRRA